MFLWFVGGSVGIVWLVFHSTRLDYRLIALGAVLPSIEVVSGRDWIGHTLVAPIVVLGLVMALTQKRRTLRRQWLCLPIGMFCHLLLDGVWTRQELFWWPVFGGAFAHESSLMLGRGWVMNVGLEVAGAVILVWAWKRFELADPARRQRLITTGTLDPALARGPEAGM